MQIHNIEAAFREVMSVQLPWVIKMLKFTTKTSW